MTTVDIVVRWGRTPIAVERVSENESFTIGAAATADRHFLCEHPSIPAARFALVDNKDGVRVRAAPGMQLLVDGRRTDAPEIVLGPTSNAAVHVGPLEVRVGRDRRAPTVLDRLRDVVDARLLRLSGVALALHAGFVALLLLARAPDRLDDLQALAPRFAVTTTHAHKPLRPITHATTTTTASAHPATLAVRSAHESTRHRVLQSARALADDVLASLHLDRNAPSRIFGAGGPRLDDVRGASFGPGNGASGLGTRDTGSGGGGTGVDVGGIVAHGLAGDDARALSLTGTTPHSSVTVPKRAIELSDGLSRDEIQRVISRVMPQIKYCYEKQLNQAPDLEGKLALSWVIAADGTVASAQIAQSTLAPSSSASSSVGTCVQTVIARQRFPSPRGGGTVVVTYPFVFSSAG